MRRALAFLQVCVGGLASLGTLGAQWFEETGKRAMPWRELHTLAVATGDVDGDGDIDVLFGHGFAPLSLYLNDGAGAYSAAPIGLPAPQNHTHALLFVDVDGDRDLDLLVANSRLRLFRNDGHGRFTDATQQLPAGPSIPREIAAADLDGDGDLDLVLAIYGQNRIYTNDGAGWFTDATSTAAPILEDPTLSLSLGDVDGDGDIDAVFGNTNQTRDRVWLNDGSGRFVDATVGRLPDHPAPTTDAALGDLDGDGDLDLVFTTWDTVDRVYLNDGTGHFSFVIGALPTVGWYSSSCALADIDGDGDLDIFVGTFFQSGLGNRAAILFNRGDGTFFHRVPSPALLDNTTVNAAVFADVDRDGDPDLLLATGSDLYAEQDRLCINDGTGRFRNATERSFPPDRHGVVALAVGDLDGDGDRDLVLCGAGCILFVNDGQGRFREQSAFEPRVFGTARAVVLMDVDRDGDLDVFLGTNRQDRLYLNDGRGRLTDVTATHLPPDDDYCVGAVSADLGGDGDLDLILATDVVRVLRNDGTGRFQIVGGQPPTAGPFGAIAAGDVDGDGDPDVLIARAGYGAPRHELWLNDGTGRFTNATIGRMPANGTWTYGLRLVDVDADGDLDAVLASLSQNAIYLNDGNGTFRDATAAHLPRDGGANAVDAGDIDGDGDVDLVFTALVHGLGTLQAHLYFNDGSGRFSDATSELPQELQATNAIALADLDDDADLDLVMSGEWRPRVTLYANQLRHLASPYLPTLGRMHRLDFTARGGPAAPLAVIPLLAAGEARIPLPPIGTLRLDPTSVVALSPMPMPSPGAIVSLGLRLPPDPALHGRMLYAQALFVRAAGSAAFSNLVAEMLVR